MLASVSARLLDTSQAAALCGEKKSIALGSVVLASTAAGTVFQNQTLHCHFDVSLLHPVSVFEAWTLLQVIF